MITGLYCTDEYRDIPSDDLTLDQIEWLRGQLHTTFLQFMPLWELLPISTRLKNVLLRSRLVTLQDIRAVYPEKWAVMPYLGRATYRELRQSVSGYGITLPVRAGEGVIV